MQHKNILLIEDDYLDVTSVKRALAKLKVDHTLHVAHNGVDALSILMGSNPATGAAQKIQPDVILLDINMPKMNGLEFLNIIKKYYSLSNIKVFVMTTSAEEYDRNEAQRMGISGYILKPLDFEKPRHDESVKAISALKEALLQE